MSYTYKVQRWRGYMPWGVTNPWVFANFGQPQRHRGYVSPMAFQTNPPRLLNHHLGLGQTAEDEDRARARRMEWVALASFATSILSLWIFYDHLKRAEQASGMRPNVKKRTRGRAQTVGKYDNARIALRPYSLGGGYALLIDGKDAGTVQKLDMDTWSASGTVAGRATGSSAREAAMDLAKILVRDYEY